MVYICKYNDTHTYTSWYIVSQYRHRKSKVVNPTVPQPPVTPWVVIMTTEGSTKGNQINGYGRAGTHRSPKLCDILSCILWKNMQCIPKRQFRHWKTKSRHDATLLPPAASEVVILTTCDATSDDKVGITTTLCPQPTFFKWRYLLRQPV